MFMVVRKLKTKHFLFPHPFQQVSTQISKHTDCEVIICSTRKKMLCLIYIIYLYYWRRDLFKYRVFLIM